VTKTGEPEAGFDGIGGTPTLTHKPNEALGFFLSTSIAMTHL
jgi:hypothetical protein